MYCPLLKRIQLTFTGWVEALNTQDAGQGKTYRSCQKYAYHFITKLFNKNTGRHLLWVSFIRSLK
jgi:hypothetical protein